MVAVPPQRTVYRFDRFALDLGRGALLSDAGAEVPLRPKAFAVLRLLVENAGRLLDRDTILAAVWPDVVVTDASITQCIRELREALGDEAQVLLRTVPKRGYVLLAEVTRVEAAAPVPRVARRLAAILAADVVGYSRLMEGDETGTLAALKACRSDVVEPVVHQHGGRIVKLMGDGVLVEFTSAVNAVAGALEVQRRMAEAEAGAPEERRIRLRIGLTMGDVIDDGGDIYGDAVNIAARLETLAEPGGICISANLQDEVRGKLAAGFVDLGEQQLKNLSRPIRAFRVGVFDEGVPARPLPSLPDRPSIAVLPFQNMSGDPDQDYFADGVVEDIITALSRLRWLFVIARNSSFTYKGRAVDIKQVGRELGVRYVLEGSVRRAGGRMRITGQLIDAATGAHLWADRFDGEIADVFDLQDRITASVVGAISPRLEQAEIERAQRKPTESLDAYDYYLRGLAAFHRFERAANAEALAMFARATALDPGFAAAYGMAARTYMQRKGFGWVEDPPHELAESARLARQAADLGGTDALAVGNAGAALLIFNGELEAGAALLDRALQLNGNLAWLWHFSALAKAYLGDADAAIDHADRALRLSPQDPQMFGMLVAKSFAHFAAGRHDEALAWAEAALHERANFFAAACCAAAAAGAAGRPAEAERAVARLRELRPGVALSDLATVFPFRQAEVRARWAEGLRVAGLTD